MATPMRSRSPSPTLYSQNVLPSTQNVPDAARQVPEDSALSLAQDQSGDSNEPIDGTAPSIQAESMKPAEPEAEPTPIPVTSKVSITLLLVSGRRRTVEFEPSITIRELKETVWSTWPTDWSDELPPSAAFLRILYLGRILTDETTLQSLNLPEPPESTVVHVSVRSFAPTSSDEDLKKKPKKRGSRRSRASGADGGTAGADAADDGELEDEGAGGCCGCVIC